jgi:hypothetical protein
MKARVLVAFSVFLYMIASLQAIAWQTNAHQTVDASGQISVSTFDSNGKLMKVTDGMGRHTFSAAPAPVAAATTTTTAKAALAAAASSGIIIHVPADQPTIQAGINAANNGDTVLVSDGTYTENINFSGKAITLTSVNGPATTIIDGGAADTVVTFNTSEGSGSVLNGFTIQNGFSNFNKPNFGDGGGIFISNASPTITNNVINNNKGCDGEGIYSSFGNPLIQGNIITNNKQSGCTGGIGGGGIAVDGASTAQIIGNVIANNSLFLGANGGGISLFAASAAVVQGNVIYGNNGASQGGGLATANDSSHQIVNNLFFNNTAAQGGGIYWAIPVSSPGMTLLNNTLAANSSTSGSAIFDGGFDTNMFIQNNLIVGAAGQTAYFCNQSNGATSPAVFANNDVFSSGTAAISGNCTISTGSNGNISSDPLFIAPGLNNFRLQPGSPAIDTGNGNARIPLPATDLDGKPRVFNNIVDMGAYEFQTTTTSYSTTSLTFPPTSPSTTSAPQTITISNTGSIALQIVPLSLSGDFAEIDNCSGSSGIAPGQTCTITVTFSPIGTGVRSAQIIVTSNDAAGATTINLSGQAISVALAKLSSTSLVFGSQPVNSSGGFQNITLTNNGNIALTIAGIAITGANSGDFSQTNNCGSSVAAGSSCIISVSFGSLTTGAESASLAISDNAPGSPQTVALSGMAFEAIAALSATSLSFGNQLVGSPSAAQSVTLTNSGNIAMTISSIFMSGANSGDFSQTNNCGTSVAAGSSCSINIVFTPSALGARSVSMVVGDSAIRSPQTVALSGTGAGPIAAFSFTPANFGNFGNQPVGSSSAAQSLMLTNNGDAALTISGIAITGANGGDFGQTNNCGTSVAPGSSCSINIVFTPSALGARSASMAITDNASGSPLMLFFSGTGTGAIAALSLTSLSFGNQAVGSSSTAQSMTLTNNGNAALTISGIALTGANSGDFSQTNNCGTSVAPGSSCSISIVFTPSAIGARSASLCISDNASGSLQTVALSGTGTVAVAALSVTSLSFGIQPVGSSSTAQSVTLTNNGNAALTISGIALTGANSGDFSQTNNCGTSVAPGSSCSISLVFTPGAIGARSASLAITDNAGGSPQTVALSGTGTGAIVALSVTSLSFGNQSVGSSSTAQNVTLTNNGNAALTISVVAVTGANSGDFSQTNNCGTSLAPAGSCSINVVFMPTAAGSRSASLAIADNAGGSPQTVTLSGTGQDFSMSASPSSLTIQKRSHGSSTITLTPLGGFNQTVALSCGGLPANTTCSVSPASVTLNGTSASTAQLTVTTGKTAATFNVLVTGQFGPLTHTTTVSVTVP